MNKISRNLFVAMVLLLGSGTLIATGCSQKETILDVETPGGEVEVTKDKTDGEIEVDVDVSPP